MNPNGDDTLLRDLLAKYLILERYDILSLIVEDLMHDLGWFRLRKILTGVTDGLTWKLLDFFCRLLGHPISLKNMNLFDLLMNAPDCHSLRLLRETILELISQRHPGYQTDLMSQITELKRSRGKKRDDLIERMGQPGNFHATTETVSVLRTSSSAERRHRTALALARIGDSSAVVAILKCLATESSPDVVEAICNTIESLAHTSDIDDIIETIKKSNPAVQRRLGRCLGVIREQERWFDGPGEQVVVRKEMNALAERIARAYTDGLMVASSLSLPTDSITKDDLLARYVTQLRARGIPEFVRRGNQWLLKTPETFELSVFSKAIWSFFASLDCYPAGFLLEQQQHYQFALFAHYTSALHAVVSFLACHGVSIVSNPSGEYQFVSGPQMSSAGRAKLNGPSVLVGRYGKGRWAFVPSTFSHVYRWKDFGRAILPYLNSRRVGAIPDEMFHFLFLINRALGEAPNAGKYNLGKVNSLGSLVEDFCRLIPDWRHDAIYRDYAFDDHVFAALLNNEGGLLGLNRRIVTIRALNQAMLKWQAQNLWHITKNLVHLVGPAPAGEIRSWVSSEVLFPAIVPTKETVSIWMNLDTTLWLLFEFWRLPLILE